MCCHLLSCLLLLSTYQHAPGGRIWVESAGPDADSGPAIREAIVRARAAGPAAEVRLRAGVFRVSSASDEDWFIAVGGDGLTLSGEAGATEIIFTDPRKGGFIVQGATGLRIRNLIIDYDPPPFTQGTVVAVDAANGRFDLRLDAGFPTPDAPWFATGDPVNQMGMAIEAQERRPKRGAPDFFLASGWREREAGVWTIQLAEAERGKAKHLVAGDRFVLLSRRGNGAFLFSETTDCRLEDVTVHASPSLTVSLTGSDRMTVRELAVTFRDGATRLIASNGDGIHCQRNRGGPLIEGCLFEGLCDDGVNIYAPPLIVRQVLSLTQIAVTRSATVRPGDLLQVFDPQAGVVRALVKATGVEERQHEQIVTLDRPIAGIVAGADHRTADTVYNLSASGAGYVIRNNHFRDHRRFGLNLRAGEGLVEGNKFEQLGGHGISVGNEPSWPEGPVASDILIQGNHFIGGGYSQGYGDGKPGPAISIRGLSLDGLARPPLLRGIRVEGNRFEDASTPAISVRSARDVTLQDNRMPGGAPVEVHVEASEGVLVDPR